MHSLWNRLNHKIKHQVYLRVLPVVALSILVVGGVGWGVLTREVTQDRTQVGFHEIEELRGKLNLRIVKEALSFEACLASVQPQTENLSRVLAASGARADLLAAVGLIDHRGTDDPELEYSYLEPALTSCLQEDDLENWVRLNGRYLARKYQQGSWIGARTGDNPHLIDSSPWHSIFLFPAIIASGEKPSASQTLLPVLVRGEGRDQKQVTLYFFKLESLVQPCNPGLWFCLLDESGRILYSVGGSPAPGTRLAKIKRLPGHPVLSSLKGTQLLEALENKNGTESGNVGKGLVPWIVLRSENPDMGFTVLMVDRVRDLSATVTGYLWLLVLAVVLALGGAVLGINRVMKRNSDRLTNLAANMESLADGKYGGRMIPGRRDEMGALVGYFNLMANSLEEAHREVKEKAAHLRAALENLRMLDKAKDDFMVLISHEVRTPLTAIMGGVDYLKKSVEKVEGEERAVLDRLNVQEITEIIQSSGERLSGFMTDAIQMTSMGSAGTSLNLRPVPVADLVARGLCGVVELASEKQVAVHNQLDNQWSWSILCDLETLRVGFEKIFRNAVTHNRKGGVIIIREAAVVPGQGPISELIGRESLRRLEGQQSFRDFQDEDLRWRMIEIFNTGEPIPADRRAALFGKFELVGRIENHQKGSGLSLPIAKAAVESHGGRIFLYSDGKDGNSFFLMLPTVLSRPENPVKDGDKLGDDVHQSVGGASRNKKVSKVGNPTSFEVELDDLCTSVLGRIDEIGSRENSTGSADHQEEITVSSGGE